jgi:hypothetical protein
MCSKNCNSQDSDDNQGDEDDDDNDDYYNSFIYISNKGDFFLNPVLALCITDNFPSSFNAGACKFDNVLSVVSELIM